MPQQGLRPIEPANVAPEQPLDAQAVSKRRLRGPGRLPCLDKRTVFMNGTKSRLRSASAMSASANASPTCSQKPPTSSTACRR